MRDQPPEDGQSPIHLPIDGVLDLHAFRPADLPELLEDYIEACRTDGILEIRVIHGKGRGILRQRVRHLLARHPDVAAYGDAGPGGGGWGATRVTLRPLA